MEVDFALVCATHCRLREAADKGSFRSDLYYRINGLTLQLPALRERTDFQAVTHQLLAGLNPHRDIHLEADLLCKMAKHSWPGNLRQLASVLRTASAMLGPHENSIDWNHLPDDMVEDLSVPTKPAIADKPPNTAPNLQDLAKTAIQQTLATTKGNVSQAARVLGISRQTMYRKMALHPSLTSEFKS